MGIFDSIKSAFSSKEDPESDPGVENDSPKSPEEQPPVPLEESEEAPEAMRPDEGSGQERTYTVKSGDTLWKIAERMYGDGSAYMRIFEANRNLLDDPDRILPGQELLIPDAGD